MTMLADALDRSNVVLDVEAADARAVLRTLGATLAPACGATARSIEEALAARERLGSTALGHGFAVPHARIAGLAKAHAAFVRTRAPVDFGAPDRRPVRHFVALLVPAHAAEHHLRLLAETAERLSDRAFRDALRCAVTPDEVAALFATPSARPDERGETR